MMVPDPRARALSDYDHAAADFALEFPPGSDPEAEIGVLAELADSVAEAGEAWREMVGRLDVAVDQPIPPAGDLQQLLAEAAFDGALIPQAWRVLRAQLALWRAHPRED